MAPAITLSAIALLSQILGVASAAVIARSAFPVSSEPPSDIAAVLPEAFVSFSIELAFFPDYAGNSSSPNTFSNNLLDNIGSLTGTKPYIRVGGNTQDIAIFDGSQKEGLIGIYAHPSDDYPDTITIGPAFFESYQTWPDTKFTHGFNLKAADTTTGANSLTQSAAVACKYLDTGNLLAWEYGNEPDLYIDSDSTYITRWLSGTRSIKASIANACPSMAESPNYGYIAPSCSSTGGAVGGYAFSAGLNADKDIELISFHLYMGSATGSGVTLQGTLMNHQHTTSSVSAQVKEMNSLAYTGIPYILGEANSLFHEGKAGLSNTFGAALWGVDFNLWCASVGIRRVHMHQGTSYRYASWQPIQASKEVIGTKPPYYGNIAVAAMLGNLVTNDVQILNIELTSTTDAAYAAYVDKKLARILVINMNEYNSTVGGQLGAAPNPVPRPSTTYSFSLDQTSGTVQIQRLLAGGSDAITGISWDGYSYNYELDNGKPVRLNNVTVGQTAEISGGVVSVSVPDSSLAVLSFGADAGTGSTTASSVRTSTSTSQEPTTTSTSSSSCAALYGQCGGDGWTGPTCCVSGSTCTYSNAYYSQCLA